MSKARSGETIVRAGNEDEAAWRRRVAAAWRREIEDPEACFEPRRRHEAMLRTGWMLTVRGLPEPEIRAALLDLATRRCTAEGRFAAPEAAAETRESDTHDADPPAGPAPHEIDAADAAERG